MKIDKETRARINRENAQKSTGPRTAAGKAISRTNALKHGLASNTIDPINGPGELEGVYQKYLDFWITDVKPQNVFEMSMVQRACRASWKLDRCARFEDAAAKRRTINGPPDAFDKQKTPNQERAREIGAILMFALCTKDLIEQFGPPNLQSGPSFYDDAPRDADLLATFKEGVEWLINAWQEIMPYLPLPDGPPIEGAKNVLQRAQERALRLLGIATHNPPPAQNLHEAGEAELRRLAALHAKFDNDILGRLDADLCLFDDSPKSQLLNRYEMTAERNLHKAIDTFMKLRKHPELIEPSDVVEPTPDRVVEVVKTAEKRPVSSSRRLAPNEANFPTPPQAKSTPSTGVREGEKGQTPGR